jgi:hypothetical protein
MKKNNSTYIDNLVKRLISETLEEKADSLVSKIKSNVNELGGMDDGHPRFGKLNLSKMSDKDIEDLMKQPVDHDDEDEDEDFSMRGHFFDDEDGENEWESEDEDDFEEIDEDECMECGKSNMYEGSEVCECGDGTMVSEGMCMECGLPKMEEGIYDEDDLDNSNEFDYVAEEDDTIDFEEDETEKDEENKEFCKYQKKMFGSDDERYLEKCSGESAIKDLSRRPISMNERLRGNQSKIDKNKNGKIDAEDFKMLRKGSMEESEKFIQKATKKMEKKGTEGKFGSWCKRNGLDKDGEVTKKCIDKALKSDDSSVVKMANFAKNIKGYKGAEHKESVKLSESEMIDLIEKIVLEQKEEKEVKSNIKAMQKPKGLAVYEKAVNGSKKENDDYIKSVAKKMKDYLKDGSKGEYNESPKHFPKGNGELAKMSKKAYIPSDAVKDFTDNLTAAGQENLVYDEIHPNEDWVTDNIEGSSRTGNNPEWANTGESNVNKKRNEIRKKNLLGQIKKKAYNKAPQPIVSDKTGEDDGDKLMAKLESVNPKKAEKLNEEFEKMKNLISYDRKTQ